VKHARHEERCSHGSRSAAQRTALAKRAPHGHVDRAAEHSIDGYVHSLAPKLAAGRVGRGRVGCECRRAHVCEIVRMNEHVQVFELVCVFEQTIERVAMWR
jgi:hypothetical protein